MGDAASAGQTVGVVGSSTAGIATAILGHMTAGGVTGILGITSAAVPVIGAGLMAATLVIQYLVTNSGCGQTCVVTSAWANQAAEALQKVMDAYFALPAPRTEAQKAVAVGAFKAIWSTLQQQCGQPGTGDAGKRCISDRQEGACVWHQKYAPVYPGQPNIGECWNWFNGYLGPILADKVVSDANSISQGIDSIFGGGAAGGPSLGPLLLIGGLVALGVAL
jgi:hypothetical protein